MHATPVYYFHGQTPRAEDLLWPGLKTRFPGLQVPEFDAQAGPYARAEQALAETQKVRNGFLIASDLGALTAALLYQQRPERFSHLLLIAPTWGISQAEPVSRIEGLPADTLVIAWHKDQQTSYAELREVCERLKLARIDIDGSERQEALPLILESASRLMNGLTPP